MDGINEHELRELLLSHAGAEERLIAIHERLQDTSLSWEEQRGLWFYLRNTHHVASLQEWLTESLRAKFRVPFDLIVELAASAKLKPSQSVLISFWKGIKKHKAQSDLLVIRDWDAFDPRLAQTRRHILNLKLSEKQQQKDHLRDKFYFLKNQRMTEQAGRVLRRWNELFPGDPELAKIQAEFDEEWAREVLANHLASIQANPVDASPPAASPNDEQMLQCFLEAGTNISEQEPDFALDLAVAFWFMEDYNRALSALGYAPLSVAADWMRVEVLLAARRFVEALEHLNHLEMKYNEDPETTFAVSYLRAQGLYGLGQQGPALEILRSIVRVRAQFRSAHALILQWSNGVGWE